MMSADTEDRMKNEKNLTMLCAVIQRVFVSSLAAANL